MAEALALRRVRHRAALTPFLWGSVAALALATGAWVTFDTSTTTLPAVAVLSVAPTPSKAPSPRFPDIPKSRPIALSIPSLGVTTSVGVLGLQADGQVQVPTTSRVVGWYRYGVTPGQVGSAVILGHVDSYQGPGEFFNLKSLKAGQYLKLTLADGTQARFVVTEVVQYLKTAFPDRSVYGAHGASRSLQLVTCGGAFDQATGHYLSNVVVYSHLVGVTVSHRATA
ncbi:MAG: Sortase family protein [Acidimicrobiaceae bacterium]|nr:Sortase family protein [Acidimicrobiaceae bacterium]